MVKHVTGAEGAESSICAGKTILSAGMAFAIAALIAIVSFGASIVPTDKAVAAENLDYMYRMYNQWTGEHFYTKSAAERNDLMNCGWTLEGIGWRAPLSGEPVYRLFNQWTGDHHYTTDAAERDKNVAAGWTDEGVGWYSMGSDAAPLYRLYNPNAQGAGAHHYTTSKKERKSLIEAGWIDEGVGWYGEAPTAADRPFYALFLGNDSRYGTVEDPNHEVAEDGPCRADTIMLARIDPVLLRVSILSIPRDTMCYFNGNIDKINANHYYGPEGMVDAVEALTGVRASYYFDLKFIDFDAIVEGMSGVNGDVPFNLSGKDMVRGGPTLLYGGNNQLLGGGQALYLARCRYQYAADGESFRQISARQLVQNGIVKAANSGLPATFYASLMKGASVSNVDEELLADMVDHFMGHGNEIQFQLGTGPYTGYMDWDANQWYVPRDENTYRKLVRMMKNGGDLTSVVPLVTNPEKARKDMYRLYNQWSGEHFFTADEGERDNLVWQGWTYEGVGWCAPAQSGTPVYRLYNPYAPSGDHHYTTDANERRQLTDAGWVYEGVCWYSDDFQAVPLYREYNPNAPSCNHNYTKSRKEHNNLISLGWVNEGKAWYGI